MSRLREDTVSHAVANMEYASKLDIPHLDISRPRPGTCVVVGGGPTAPLFEDDYWLSELPDRRLFVIALNWTHTWLIKRGIVPDACVFFEIDADPLLSLQEPHRDVTYYVCSHCHKRTHESLRGFKTVLWQARVDPPEMTAAQSKFFPGEPLLSGGSTTLIRAIDLGRMLGYRSFELFGCDSSFEQDGPTHIPGYPLEAYKGTGFLDPIKVHFGEGQPTFWTSTYLAQQAEHFRQWCLANHSVFLMKVHGDTLLRYLHQHDWPEQYGG